MSSVLSWLIIVAVSLTLTGAAQGQTGPNEPTSYQEMKPDRDAPSSVTPPLTSRLKHSLWESRISPPDPNEDLETRQSIQELIQKIRSMKFEDAAVEPTFKPPSPKPVTKRNPNQAEPTTTGSEETTDSNVAVPMATTAPQAALSEVTEKKLKQLLKDPNQVSNPLEVAELLFLSGRLVQAGVFYQRALDTMPRDSTGTNSDRAWALFQLGNCLRETDIAKAKEKYMKLVSEYPTSPWTELAKAHGRLITWYQSAKPKQLVSQEKSP